MMFWISKRTYIVSAIAAWAISAGACSEKHDAGAVPPHKGTEGGDVSRKGTPTTSATTVGKPAMFLAGDTARPKLIAGRNAHDSVSFFSAIRRGQKSLDKWPVEKDPLSGAILPAKRIVAFYGNPLSKKMGVLGEYPVDQMLGKLDQAVAEWKKADPSTPVQPALHLIAVVAQGAPGRDGMYRLRMDTSLIEKVYGWAQQKNALLFLDIQVGKSNLQAEIPRLLPFLSRPNVHLAVDPEFSMHYEREGMAPGRKIGEMSGDDVN